MFIFFCMTHELFPLLFLFLSSLSVSLGSLCFPFFHHFNFHFFLSASHSLASPSLTCNNSITRSGFWSIVSAWEALRFPCHHSRFCLGWILYGQLPWAQKQLGCYRTHLVTHHASCLTAGDACSIVVVYFLHFSSLLFSFLYRFLAGSGACLCEVVLVSVSILGLRNFCTRLCATIWRIVTYRGRREKRARTVEKMLNITE